MHGIVDFVHLYSYHVQDNPPRPPQPNPNPTPTQTLSTYIMYRAPTFDQETLVGKYVGICLHTGLQHYHCQTHQRAGGALYSVFGQCVVYGNRLL